MSVTTPPPAPKKRPAFLEPKPVVSPPKKTKTAEEIWDEAMNKAFPPGQFVPIVLTPKEEEEIFESSWKHLPAWFHFEKVNGVIRPRSFADKKKLLAALEKL
jgi:hypothetical protein